MPAQVTKSKLLAKYGKKLEEAAKRHAGAPIEYGPQRLPPGITNGVAKLVVCTFAEVASGKTNAGQLYFRAAGVICEPESVVHNGQAVPVKGQQTSIMEMVCDTKTQAGKTTTMEEHVANVQNEMKKLLGDGYDPNDLEGANLEATAAALEQAGIYFRFSTSVRRPMKAGDAEGVWENWHGTKGLENYTPTGGSNGQVEDHSGETAGEGGDAGVDVDALVATASEDGDGEEQKEAREQLIQLAVDAGHEREVAEAADGWQDVADLAANPPEAAAEEAAEAVEEPKVPEKGEDYAYRARDPKGNVLKGKDKKPVAPVPVEVLTVNAKNGTVTVKNSDTGKTTSTRSNTWLYAARRLSV